VSLYLLNNILLAAIYDAYKEQMKTTICDLYKNRNIAVDHAFALLSESGEDGEHFVTLEKWMAFFTAYCDAALLGASPEVQEFSKLQGLRAFQAMDADGSQELDKDEFHLVVSVLADPKVYIPLRPFPAASTGWGKRLVQLFKQGITLPGGARCSWDSLVDVVILMEVILAFVQTCIFVSPAGGGEFAQDPLMPGSIWFQLLSATTAFFAAEIILKIAVLGMERFWFQWPIQHRFDLISVAGLAITETICMLSREPPDGLVRIVVLLHAARCLRLAQHVRPLRFLAHLISRLVPVYNQLGLLLLLAFYIFATLGEQLFGGLIWEDNPKLENSAFASSSYFVINFNDFPSGLVTLFTLMVVNNWFVIADGFIRVTDQWAAVFFVAFFVIINLIVLNILMALILDSSAAVREELLKTTGDAGLPALDQRVRREFVLQRLLLNEEESQQISPAPGQLSPSNLTRRRQSQAPGSDGVESFNSSVRGLSFGNVRTSSTA